MSELTLKVILKSDTTNLHISTQKESLWDAKINDKFAIQNKVERESLIFVFEL